MKNLLLSAAAGLLLFTACNDNDEIPPALQEKSFTVTIENIQTPKPFFLNGATDAAGPGGSYSYTFDAGKGAYLSFATMFVQSNDLFYGFEEKGLALYDTDGNPVTGDVTSDIKLWDAGTEVNQEPGSGADQAPRQSGANTGAAENSTVKLISEVNDGFSYPATNEVIKVMLAHNGGTQFTVTLNNVSNAHSFQTPVAPGVWVVHYGGKPIFTKDQAAANGLEGLAEDGATDGINTYLTENSGFVTPFAPGVFVAHQTGYPIFENNKVTTANGLEALAEDGNPGTLNTALKAIAGIKYGVFNTPKDASSPAPIFPNESYQFSFTATQADKLNLATMLVQSNDLFLAFDDTGIALFQNGQPISGDITSHLKLWDAGTEVNEYPGAGNNQAPRQGAANTGTSEQQAVKVVNDGFTYPAIDKLVRVTITSN
ncbi:hypothetical protein EMN47_08045 [Prolixibacteraceae bacterium JC049]|nr:hypothetical protein [Prolixibacteraceae bacterium JC049]